MRSRILYILIMLILISCDSMRVSNYTRRGVYNIEMRGIGIYIDKDFNGDEVKKIGLAIEQWNYALNGYIRLRVEGDIEMDMEKVGRIMNRGDWMIWKVNGGIDSRLGWADRVGGNNIYIRGDKVRGDWYSGVVLHEIGHLMGVGHTGYLMDKYYNMEGYSCIDERVMMEVVRYWGLDINRVNYCVK